jgi:hypothetical protein
MGLRETQFARIAEELDRIGCVEVRISHVGVDQRAVFVRRDEAVTIPYALAMRALLRKESFRGDDEVWDALLTYGRKGLA